jgi:hypothetical protein
MDRHWSSTSRLPSRAPAAQSEKHFAWLRGERSAAARQRVCGRERLSNARGRSPRIRQLCLPISSTVSVFGAPCVAHVAHEMMHQWRTKRDLSTCISLHQPASACISPGRRSSSLGGACGARIDTPMAQQTRSPVTRHLSRVTRYLVFRRFSSLRGACGARIDAPLVANDAEGQCAMLRVTGSSYASRMRPHQMHHWCTFGAPLVHTHAAPGLVHADGR